MHVVVVGAGVVGVTTAYYLSQQGCQVTVIDRATDVASGASYGNGGQLSYSFTDALAKPEFISQIPGLLSGLDPGSRVHLSASLLPWGARFLTQCTRRKANQNTLAVLQLALRSAGLMAELRAHTNIEFSFRDAGKLVLLSDRDELLAAERSTALKCKHGSDVQVLDRDQAIATEPAIADFSSDIVGAVYSQQDAVADARLFSVQLSAWLKQHTDVKFMLGYAVDGISKPNGRVAGVTIDDEEIAADATVVCAGAWANKLLAPLGVSTHIYPVRGYSVTLPPGDSAPNVSVSALKQRIVYSRLNGSMRIAGFADFDGFRSTKDAQRIATLLSVAKEVAPRAANFDAEVQHHWGGFRPMTPNGQPQVGESPVRGLYLNAGHGMLGWTLACATGRDVADAVSRTAH